MTRPLLPWLALLLLPSLAHAHKASDAFLKIIGDRNGMTLRWDIALRDLDVVLDLDSNGDGRLSWLEIKQAWPRIEQYAVASLRIDDCILKPVSRALERRNDGAYAVLVLRSSCVLGPNPAIGYSLLADIDPTHRGIAQVKTTQGPATLRVLVPMRLSATTAPLATERWSFIRDGVHHILIGYDHLLFLWCLLLPAVLARHGKAWSPVPTLGAAIWPAVKIVSTFTVAHSVTLALAAFKIVSIPSSIIEPAIALTIIVAAMDNLFLMFTSQRVAMALLFGLIHGFGFAAVLGELDLPRMAFIWALLQFNIGIEAGQLIIVTGLVGLLFLARRQPWYRLWVVQRGSIVAAMLAAVWLLERVANLSIIPG